MSVSGPSSILPSSHIISSRVRAFRDVRYHPFSIRGHTLRKLEEKAFERRVMYELSGLGITMASSGKKLGQHLDSIISKYKNCGGLFR